MATDKKQEEQELGRAAVLLAASFLQQCIGMPRILVALSVILIHDFFEKEYPDIYLEARRIDDEAKIKDSDKKSFNA